MLHLLASVGTTLKKETTKFLAPVTGHDPQSLRLLFLAVIL